MAGKSPVVKDAMKTPTLIFLSDKRVILASTSPRRKEILETFGLVPEIVPSKFDEDFSHDEFESPTQYVVATASEKGVEVYRRLVGDDPENPPDIVIGADTIVVSTKGNILEKPGTKEACLDMLMDLNGTKCSVITAVTIISPTLESPGYKFHSFTSETGVYFLNNPPSLLQAYVDSGEGVDRAGGFAIQGKGGILIDRIEGDYWNVVGFPGGRFWDWLAKLIDEEELSLD